MLQFKTVRFALQGRQQTISFHSQNILSICGNAHLTLYHSVPVSSTSCNLCPKSI